MPNTHSRLIRNKVEESGDRDDLRQKSSGKNDTLPTMKLNHKYRNGDGKRHTAKKEGRRLAGGERRALSRCLFLRSGLFSRSHGGRWAKDVYAKRSS